MAIKDISDFALFYSPGQYDARLSLSPTAAITVPDMFATTQLYLHPFRGNLFSLWDTQDLTWRAVQFTLVTIPVPFTTNLQFDLYAYLNPNRASISVETVDWLNDTTRAVPLALFQGAVVKSGDITRKYIGTGRTTGVAGQTEDSRANRLLRNYANYVRRIITLMPGYVNADTTTSILVTNTAWQDNMLDAAKKGRLASKLTPKNVREIMAKVERGEKKARIAELYGIDSSTLSSILSGKSWSHVTGIKHHGSRDAS